MSTSDVLTLIIALYGAIFSTVLAIQKNRTRVTVFFNVEPLTTAEGTKYVVEVSALNDGYSTVEIRELGFRGEYDTILSQKFDPPAKVEPKTSIRQRFTYEEVKKKLGTISTVFAEDTRRRSYSLNMDRREKERLIYTPAFLRLTTVVRSLGHLEDLMDLAEQQQRQTQEGLQEQADELQNIVRKRQEWDGYRERTGETHPKEQELIDATLRHIHGVDRDDQEGVSKEQEGSDRV